MIESFNFSSVKKLLYKEFDKDIKELFYNTNYLIPPKLYFIIRENIRVIIDRNASLIQVFDKL